jgi:predicted transcriptional regulator YdeE
MLSTFDYDHTQSFSYFIGCKVKSDTETPQGMDSLIIPKENYSKVVSKGKMPDCVAHSWKDIQVSTIGRAFSYDFEIYDERSEDWTNAEV